MIEIAYEKTENVKLSDLNEFQGNLKPDVTKIVWKWGRWQHSVDYRPFRKNKLIKRKDINIENKVNNYGMVLKKAVN